MGSTVTDIAAIRRRRERRRRAAARLAPLHPALRWLTVDEKQAHRRAPHGATVCGVAGPLRLANGRVAFCPDCYPGAS